MKVRTVQNSFSGGYFSMRARARFDAEAYRRGLGASTNLVSHSEGGIGPRPGFAVAGLAVPASEAKLYTFRKSVSDSLILDFTPGKLSVWKTSDQTRVQSGGSDFELVTPWGTGQLQDLYFEQSNDVVYVAHRGHSVPTKTLVRQDDDTFALIDWDIREGPWVDGPVDVTLSISSATGATVITASSAVFEAGHVGSLLQIREGLTAPSYGAWVTDEDSTQNELVFSNGRIYRRTTSGKSKNGSYAPQHEEGTRSDGKVSWAFVHDGAGLALITGFISATEVNATALSELPVTSQSINYSDPDNWVYTFTQVSTDKWAFQALSDVQGHAGIVALYQSRLYLIGSAAVPDSLFAGEVNGYSDTFGEYKPGLPTGEVVDSDAFTRSLGDGRAERISWAVSADALYLGGPGGVSRVMGPSPNEAPTPAAVMVRLVAPVGASAVCLPVLGVNSIMYPSWSGRTWYELALGDEAAQPSDRSVLAADLLTKGVVEAALAYDPDRLLAVRLSDGRLVTCTYDPEQDNMAWHSAPLGGGGLVQSVTSAPDSQRLREAIWARIDRGGQVTMEVMQPVFRAGEQDPSEACVLDGAAFYDGRHTGSTALTVAFASSDRFRDEVVTLSASADQFVAEHIGRTYRLISTDDQACDIVITAVTEARTASGTLSLDVDTASSFDSLTSWSLCATVLLGLVHPDGTELAVFGDGMDLGKATVTSASVTIPEGVPVSHAWVGLAYEQSGEPLAYGGAIATGDGLHATFSVTEGLSHILSAGHGLEFFNTTTQEVHKVPARKQSDLLGQAPAPVSEVFKIDVMGGWGRETTIGFRNLGPAPFELGYLMVKGHLNDT